MIRKELAVTNPKGIHARPSALIMQAAKGYASRITLEFQAMTADATDIMEVLSLGVACGDTLLVSVDGEDEEAALGRIEEIFALNFNDT
jgi:phosphocarrier protein HPr